MTNEANPDDLRRAQTEADYGGHVDGTTRGIRRIEGCTCGISPAGTDPFLISALEEILDAFKRSLD